MSSPELLSPAGNWDSLKAAVSEGADAVYLGVGDYNARRRADNFKSSELKEAAGFCHGRGVRCYLALNTLVKNSELPAWAKTVEDAYAAGFDAIIIQDVALIGPLKDSLPDLEVHISTQAGVFNRYWGDLLKRADRVIMPREMTLNQAREFTEATGLPAEIFVQGALCFSISGQCLMSSFLGGRSGNRGLCAQPCRKRYNGRFCMSTRDLCLAEKLPQVAASGICSLKIEGRLRSPEYVGAATAVYRRALDSIAKGRFRIDDDAYADMELAFNREYTLGGPFKEFDVVSPDEGGKRGVLLGVLEKGGTIRLNAPVMVGDGVGVIKANGSHGDIIRKIERNGKPVEAARKGETVRLQINAHDGDRIFVTSGGVRRGKYDLPRKKPISADRKARKMVFPEVAPESGGPVRLLVKTYSLTDALAAVEAGASRVFYGLFEKDYPRSSDKVFPFVPSCLLDWSAKEAIDSLTEIRPASVLCADPGVASQLTGCETYLDMSANAFNDVDVAYYNGKGMTPVISPELTLAELSAFTDKRFATYVHGRIPLMNTKYGLRESSLRDEMGYDFPVRRGRDSKQILNSVTLGLYDEILKLNSAGMNTYLLDLEEDVAQTVKDYKDILSGARIKKPKGYTIGHYKDGVA